MVIKKHQGGVRRGGLVRRGIETKFGIETEIIMSLRAGRQLRAERHGARYKDQNPLPARTVGHALNTVNKVSPKKEEDWMYQKAIVCRSVHVTATRVYFR